MVHLDELTDRAAIREQGPGRRFAQHGDLCEPVVVGVVE